MVNDTTSNETFTANTWRLTFLVIVEILGACTLILSAHHLFMLVLHLNDTVCTPATRFKVTFLFILDFCTAVIGIITLSALLGSWVELCQR